MKTQTTQKLYILPFMLLMAFSLTMMGCANMSKAGKGAAIGGAAGGAIGAIIGKATGKTATGAIVGAAVGGTAGAIIGKQMDKQAEELEAELEGVEVERVGEGIQVTFDSAILFEVNSYSLSDASKENLDDLAASLNEYPNTEIIIAGHTDSTGPDDYNEKLSEQRADAAATILVKHGVPASRLSIVGHGESQPKSSNDTAFGRQENRRVEVAIFASEAYRNELETQNN